MWPPNYLNWKKDNMDYKQNKTPTVRVVANGPTGFETKVMNQDGHEIKGVVSLDIQIDTLNHNKVFLQCLLDETDILAKIESVDFLNMDGQIVDTAWLYNKDKIQSMSLVRCHVHQLTNGDHVLIDKNLYRIKYITFATSQYPGIIKPAAHILFEDNFEWTPLFQPYVYAKLERGHEDG